VKVKREIRIDVAQDSWRENSSL